jgi:predicted PhzF superfamily epimerase YddE/YHI9
MQGWRSSASETAFVLPAEADGGRVRIFTRCAGCRSGHPWVSTAWVLARPATSARRRAWRRAPGSGRARQAGGDRQLARQAGPAVDNRGGQGDRRHAVPDPRPGGSAGVPQLMLRVADMDVLSAARPDDSAIAALGAAAAGSA